MKTATHTPGPWKNGGVDWMISQKHGTGWRYATIRGGAYDVATVWCDEDDAEQAANVALVTAAPEMLEVLKNIRDDLGCGEGVSAAEADVMRNSILAVLAKVEPAATVRHRVNVTVEVTLDTTPGEASEPGNVIMAAIEAVRDGEGVIVAHEIVK